MEPRTSVPRSAEPGHEQEHPAEQHVVHRRLLDGERDPEEQAGHEEQEAPPPLQPEPQEGHAPQTREHEELHGVGGESEDPGPDGQERVGQGGDARGEGIEELPGQPEEDEQGAQVADQEPGVDPRRIRAEQLHEEPVDHVEPRELGVPEVRVQGPAVARRLGHRGEPAFVPLQGHREEMDPDDHEEDERGGQSGIGQDPFRLLAAFRPCGR
jgi:hypothetical protein